MVRAWYMDDFSTDQKLEHHLNPPQFVDLDTLRKISGVEYFKVGENNVINEELLSKIKKDRNYRYEDDLTCCKESLDNFEAMLKKFYTEHLHSDEEIRLVLEGSGYFDVRDINDKWVRIEVVPGDLVVLPAGIYHRFTLDTKNYVKLNRLFVDEPVWVAYNRPEADDLKCRKKYLEMQKMSTLQSK